MRRLSRRQVLALAGGMSAGVVLAACSGDDDAAAPASSSEPPATTATTATTASPTSTTPAAPDLFADAATCTLTPEMTEGPFYFDVEQIRRDIREDRDGMPLRLALRVRDAAACAAIADAIIDIWHCDAGGLYSGFESASGETYLRGAQVTDANGVAEFLTLYPGGYQGRTIHIHAKVHLDNSTALTTQVYFDEAVTDAVYATEPYASGGERSTRNADDGIFDDQLLLTLTPENDGYLGVMTFDVNRA
jgi:protocatechuate 3,4-dioxygenase beta subunit